MSNIKAIITFEGSGLNTDDHNSFMGLGDSPYRLHILTGEEGNNGVLTNYKGNELATYSLSLSNTYQVNGSYHNRLTRKVYYFLYSQPYDWSGSGDYIYDNHLLEFDEDKKTIVNIFTDERNYFGLDLRYPVCDCDMIGDILYFNPRISEPKMIDVVRAKNYMDYDTWEVSPKTYLYGEKVKYFGGLFVANSAVSADQSPVTHPAKWDRIGDTYQDTTDLETVFDSELRYAFNVIRHIPVYRPTYTYASDATKNINKVRGRIFRFTQRYKYFDNTYSLFGAYSDLVLPRDSEDYNGEILNEITVNNYIKIIIPLHSASLIKEIELAFQEMNGDWKLAETINRQDITLLDKSSYTYNFYNTDAAYETLPIELFAEIQDSVPRKAATQELINKNILAYAGVTEGFNNIDKNDIDVTLTPEMESFSIPYEFSSERRNNLFDYGNDGTIDFTVGMYPSWYWRIDIGGWYPSGIVANDIYRVNINGSEHSYTIQAADVLNMDAFITAIANFLKASFPQLTITANLADNRIEGTGIIFLNESLFYHPAGTPVDTVVKKRGFKTGALHPFCIYYYDAALRRCDAQTSKENIDGTGYSVDGTTAYVPMLNEVSPLPTDTANRFKINWSVDHLPPSWAKYWRWGYAGNALCSYFVQYTINDIGDSSVAGEPANTVYIDISPLQTIKTTEVVGWNQLPNSTIDAYEFQEGDRVRIITEKSNAGVMGGLLEGVYDYQILRYDETTTRIYIQDFDHAAKNVDADSLIEIYRPLATTTSTVFYEFGELMPILEDSDGFLVHGAGTTGTQNQDTVLDNPATGTFDAGDVYHLVRTPSKPISTTTGFFMESQWYSDFYDSDDWDKGRVGVESSFGERTLNIIRYSNQYLQNTGINGLSTFEAGNYKEVSDMFGRITAMMEVGNTLKVYMEKKSASILIGRQEYVDDQGAITIASSTVVLGSIRYPENTFGTQFIESVSKNNRYVYGFDIYNATPWRDSANGIFKISGRYQEAGSDGDYKMESWFKAKSEALMQSGIDNLQVLSVWDEKYKYWILSFKDGANNNNNATIAFHEPSNRWVTFMEFEQTPEEGYNVMLELDYEIVKGFENGIGYHFDEDTRFAVFNIPQTTTNVTGFVDNVGLTFTVIDPAIRIDSDQNPDALGLTIAAVTPIPYITFVALDLHQLGWAYNQYFDNGVGYGGCIKRGINVTCEPASVISAKPSWINIERGSDILQVGMTVNSGDVLWLSPNASNDSSQRSGLLTINNPPYTDGDSLMITQGAVVTPAGVHVLAVNGGAGGTGFTVTDGGDGAIALGGNSLYFSFTPHSVNYESGQYNATYTIQKNGVTIDTGVFAVVEEALNQKYVTITGTAASGDNFNIYLDEVTVVQQVVPVDVLDMDIEAPEPTAVVSYISLPVISLNFSASEGSYAYNKTVVVTALPVSCTITAIPAWVTVFGYAVGSTINNGSTLEIYPSSDNTGIARSGSITFGNTYGDTGSLTINQAAVSNPNTVLIIDGQVYSNDPILTITPVSGYTTGASAYKTIYASFRPWKSNLPNGTTFLMYWKAYRSGVNIGGGSFTATNFVQNTPELTCVQPMNYGETITIYFSSIYF